MIDYVRYWSDKTEMPAARLVDWLGVGRSKYYDWRRRYGRVNEHNGWIPRDFWLEPWESDAIVAYYVDHPDNGYRRVTYIMMDEDIVAVSPSSVYRVLKGAGLLGRWRGTPLTLADARRIVAKLVAHYNDVRLHSAIGYIAPTDKLEGRAEAILADRDQKLAVAREARKARRRVADSCLTA